jgi:CSLREA domain-containing protein
MSYRLSFNLSKFAVLAFLGLYLVGCTPSPVCVPVYNVTKTADTNDGVCDASDCSLREAVDNANACPGAQTINLPAGGYTLTLAGAEEDANATGDLDITDDLTIQGTGAPSVSGNDADRVFEIHSGATVGFDLLIVTDGRSQLGGGIRNHGDLTIRDSSINNNVAEVPPGGTGSSAGGGIFNEAGSLTLSDSQVFSNSADHGGGIENFATAAFSATNVLIADNTVSGSGGGLWNNFAAQATLEDVEFQRNAADEHGAGIYNDGHLDGTLVTFEENVAGLNGGGLINLEDAEAFLYDAWYTNNNAAAGGGLFNQGLTHLYRSSVNNNTAFGGMGGGAYNDVAGALFLQNTTVSGNMIDAPPGLPGGSGVFNIGDLRLEFVTVAYNNRDGLRNDAGGTMTIRSSVVAYHALDNCTGTTPMNPSLGFNIEEQDTCDFIEPSDLVNTNPLLAPLASNGGNGLSHLLSPGSPAIDSGDPDKCIAEDQRLVSRPQGTACDRGAIEMEATLPITIAPSPTPTPSLGTIEGTLCYPSEGIPPMELFFEEVNTQVVEQLSHPGGTNTYSVDVLPGTYVAYAWRTDYLIGGAYTQAVPCGLSVNCVDHSLIQFQVVAGQTTSGVDICDYYGDPGFVPQPPGGLPSTPTPEGQAELQPFARFIKNAFCRKGPGTVYGTTTGYEPGAEVDLVGRSDPSLPLWWLGEDRALGFRCWFADSTVETFGPVEQLPVIQAPPTPVPLPPPAAPARLRIADWMCNEKRYALTINWIDQADNEEGYRVYRDGTLIATLAANTTSFSEEPPSGSAHTYSVEAFNASGASSRPTVQDQGCGYN